jgi:hypothetical protein
LQLTRASLLGWSTKVEDINKVPLVARRPTLLLLLLLLMAASLSGIVLLLLLLLPVWSLLPIPLLVRCTLWWLVVRVLLLKAATCASSTGVQHTQSVHVCSISGFIRTVPASQ